MRWEFTEVAEEGVVVEEDGEEVVESLVAKVWIYSSSFSVMVWMVSLRDKWFEVSFTMASSSLSEDTFERVDSTMGEGQGEHQNVRLITHNSGL